MSARSKPGSISSSSVPNVAVEDSKDSKDPISYAISNDDANGKEGRLAGEGHALNPEPPRTALGSLFRRSDKRKLDEIATQPSVFDDPQQAQYHQPHAKYENLHRFDPSFTWTWAEENSLVRKLDWRVLVWAWIAFLSLNLDQSSLIQANSDNFLVDLKLDTNDYNLGVTLFRIGFLTAEIPSQLMSKKIGPDRWIPILMILWSLVALSQFWLSGRSSFLAARAIMGLLQGGFIPDIILYLSYFYKGTELPFRLAILWTADRMKDVVVPILAFGVLRLRGVHGYAGWRWLFLIEGLINLVIGIWSIFMMAPSPTQTKAWWRPKGWFTELDEKVLVNRILRDDPSKGDMHNRQAVTPRLLWQSLCDFDLWPLYLLGLTFSIPAGPPKQYITLSLRGLGFDTFETNLLTIPPQVATSINLLILTYVSEKIGQRAYLGLFTQVWFLPCLISLAVLPVSTNKWATYALITVLLSYPTPHPMQAAWCSRNSNSVRTRAVSAALYNMASQISAIISANIYLEDDKPEYRRGNRVLVALTCYNMALYVFIKAYYTWRNNSKEKVWTGMSHQERLTYLDTTTDEGNKKLNFKFAS
ncbi:MAG: hypothetical protein M1837_005675 [Sclerophora amabilis]|nr:MAG: hypothetical protein M1837_005675 [Sclerophora amabilis]